MPLRLVPLLLVPPLLTPVCHHHRLPHHHHQVYSKDPQNLQALMQPLLAELSHVLPWFPYPPTEFLCNLLRLLPDPAVPCSFPLVLAAIGNGGLPSSVFCLPPCPALAGHAFAALTSGTCLAAVVVAMGPSIVVGALVVEGSHGWPQLGCCACLVGAPGVSGR
jgi:hypothetical protein